MPHPGDRRSCAAPGCTGTQHFFEKPPLPRPLQLEADLSPTIRQLRVWVCDMQPGHIEVVPHGCVPVRDCTVAGCPGMMVYLTKGREEFVREVRHMGRVLQTTTWKPGWVCIEQPGLHFVPGESGNGAPSREVLWEQGHWRCELFRGSGTYVRLELHGSDELYLSESFLAEAPAHERAELFQERVLRGELPLGPMRTT